MGRLKLKHLGFIPCNFHADKRKRGVCPQDGSSHTQMLIFHCCLLITVLTQDKEHQATQCCQHMRGSCKKTQCSFLAQGLCKNEFRSYQISILKTNISA